MTEHGNALKRAATVALVGGAMLAGGLTTATQANAAPQASASASVLKNVTPHATYVPDGNQGCCQSQVDNFTCC